MEWLLALLIVLFAGKVKSDSQGKGYIDAPNQNGKPGSAIFWQHQTPAGFECLGYCNTVRREGENVIFDDVICIDLTQPGGIDTPKFLSVPKSDLKSVTNVAMGCVILAQLIEAGMLDGNCGTMLFDSPAVAEATKSRLAGHNMEISRKTPNLYQVSDDTDWARFWQAANPFPVNVEITPAGVA